MLSAVVPAARVGCKSRFLVAQIPVLRVVDLHLAPLSVRCHVRVSSTSTTPQPKQSAGEFLASLPRRYFALVKEHGPAGLAVWTSLYIGPGLALYAHLRGADNYGWDVPTALAALPDVGREWAEYLLAQVSSATGLQIDALQPWHTSAALAWLAAEAAEPLRLLLTLGILRALQLRRERAAKAAAAAAAGSTAAQPSSAAFLSSQPPQRPPLR